MAACVPVEIPRLKVQTINQYDMSKNAAILNITFQQHICMRDTVLYKLSIFLFNKFCLINYLASNTTKSTGKLYILYGQELPI